MTDYKERAREMRKVILNASAELDDAQASSVPDLFPRLKKNGLLVEVGTRINWGGKIKRAAVALWDTVENNPDNAPDLWDDLESETAYASSPKLLRWAKPSLLTKKVGGVMCFICQRLITTHIPPNSMRTIGNSIQNNIRKGE